MQEELAAVDRGKLLPLVQIVLAYCTFILAGRSGRAVTSLRPPLCVIAKTTRSNGTLGPWLTVPRR